MPSIWKDLLFLHGHIADPGLARRLACEVAAPPPSSPVRPAVTARLFAMLECLGLGAIRAVPP